MLNAVEMEQPAVLGRARARGLAIARPQIYITVFNLPARCPAAQRYRLRQKVPSWM
jgi:hypothetical protein